LLFKLIRLSPECLDGAQKFLKEDGISIPYRSRSFIAPIQSYKLYTELKRCKEYGINIYFQFFLLII
jgi:hypothetical protein